MEKRIDKLKTELQKLGIMAKETEDEGWYSFTCNDLLFRCTVVEEMDFMTIGVGLYQEHEDVDRDKILDVINNINHRINYAKVIEVNNIFWITYELDVENRMPEGEEIKKILMQLLEDFNLLRSIYKQATGSADEDIDSSELTDGNYNWDAFVSENGIEQNS